MLQRLQAVGRTIQPGGVAEAAGVGGEHHGGQGHGLDAHDRQHRQNDSQTAPAHAGQVVDAENFFGFNRSYQIRDLLRIVLKWADTSAHEKHLQYTTNSGTKKAYIGFFVGNTTIRTSCVGKRERSFAR